MKRRLWALWPSRLATELNGLSGVAGVGGTAIGLAGWTVVTGATSTVLMSSGLILSLGAAAYAAVKSIPPTLENPHNLLGQVVNVNLLTEMHPTPLSVAIIGLSRAGKTTLKNRLSFVPKSDARTQVVSAFITSSMNTPVKYFALLDGGGERDNQQYYLSTVADCLTLVLDHNVSEEIIEIDPKRLDEHEEFVTQVIYCLQDNNCLKKVQVDVLMNKRDLWEQAPEEDQNMFRDFCLRQAERIRSSNYCDNVLVETHSNEIAEDVTRYRIRMSEIEAIPS